MVMPETLCEAKKVDLYGCDNGDFLGLGDLMGNLRQNSEINEQVEILMMFEVVVERLADLLQHTF